jgi:hypothetical protein
MDRQEERQRRFDEYMNEPFPIDNLPDFIKAAARKIGWRPQHKRCFGNCYMLGAPLADMGHEVFYCEGTIAMNGVEGGMPYTHAWLRVDGVDINVSGNGAPIHIYSGWGRMKHRLCIMPIEHMREKLGDILGYSMTDFMNYDNPEVAPFIGEVTPDRLTEHTTTSHLEETIKEMKNAQLV